MEIAYDQSQLVIAAESGLEPDELRSFTEGYVRSWFDLDRDLIPFFSALAENKMLSPLLGKFRGLRLIGIEDLFEALCWSVIGQQVNLTFAHKMKRAMIELYGEKVERDDKVLYLFPQTSIIANLTLEDFKTAQFSRQKATYVIALAKSFESGEIEKKQLIGLDLVQQIETLTALYGIGKWSAHYVAMRCLKAMQALPSSDVGLQNAIKQQKQLESKPTAEAVEELAKEWRGWQAYATLYLWRSLALPKTPAS